MTTYQAVIIGSSKGGIKALCEILSGIPSDFPVPIIIVSHLCPDSTSELSSILSQSSHIIVDDAEEKVLPRAHHAYIAPPNYHLLIDDDGSFALNVDPKVSFSRPSIDVSFETAAEFYQENLISVILTGANSDGTQGTKMVKNNGGLVIVQSPETAEAKTMPESVIAAGYADYIVPLENISTKLLALINGNVYE
jgi:two-component system chemotaxis response regulator CheB